MIVAVIGVMLGSAVAGCGVVGHVLVLHVRGCL